MTGSDPCCHGCRDPLVVQGFHSNSALKVEASCSIAGIGECLPSTLLQQHLRWKKLCDSTGNSWLECKKKSMWMVFIFVVARHFHFHKLLPNLGSVILRSVGTKVLDEDNSETHKSDAHAIS